MTAAQYARYPTAHGEAAEGHDHAHGAPGADHRGSAELPDQTGLPSWSLNTSRRPTWFAGPTSPSASMRSIHLAAVL